jgi:regulator of cell morphogenesis and NO signaling
MTAATDRTIAELVTGDFWFTLPSHACNTYRVVFAQLEMFEEDLHRRLLLENAGLFPAAITLERTLKEIELL